MSLHILQPSVKFAPNQKTVNETFKKKDYFDYTIQTASNLAIESFNRFVVFMSGMQALDSKN